MKNESNLDRILRIIAAVVFLYLGMSAFTGVLSVVMYALAIVMIVTAASGFCPLYKLFGISTKKDK